MNETTKLWLMGLVVAIAIVAGAGGGLLSLYEVPKLKAEITALQFDYYGGKGGK